MRCLINENCYLNPTQFFKLIGFIKIDVYLTNTLILFSVLQINGQFKLRPDILIPTNYPDGKNGQTWIIILGKPADLFAGNSFE